MYCKFWFQALDDAGGSWLAFCILILIWILSLVFDTTMIWILALCLDFEGAKNIQALQVLIWGIERHCRFLTRCKELPFPLGPHLGLWRKLEALDWGLVSWYSFGYCHWYMIHPCSKFGLSLFIFKVQKTSMSYESSSGALEDAGGSWPGFSILILIWIWSLVFDTPMLQILAI